MLRALLVSLLAAASALRPRTVIVTGATGKTGQAVVNELVATRAAISIGEVRRAVEAQLGMQNDALAGRKQEIKQIITLSPTNYQIRLEPELISCRSLPF